MREGPRSAGLWEEPWAGLGRACRARGSLWGRGRAGRGFRGIEPTRGAGAGRTHFAGAPSAGSGSGRARPAGVKPPALHTAAPGHCGERKPGLRCAAPVRHTTRCVFNVLILRGTKFPYYASRRVVSHCGTGPSRRVPPPVPSRGPRGRFGSRSLPPGGASRSSPGFPVCFPVPGPVPPRPYTFHRSRVQPLLTGIFLTTSLFGQEVICVCV